MATVEVNVTDFNVIPNAQVDQSNAIIAALANLGGSGFGNVGYFPAGIYYISKQLLSLVKATCNIMLRGDGFGKTILKIFPDQYYEDTSLSDCLASGSLWAVSNPPASQTGNLQTLNVASDTTTATNKDTVLPAFVCAKDSELIFKRRKWAVSAGGGFTNGVSVFRVFDTTSSGTTEVVTESTVNANWINITVPLAPGVHTITFRLEDNTTGQNGKTAISIDNIRVTNAMLDGVTYSEQTIFQVTGTGTGDAVQTAPFFSVRDMTFDGSLQFYDDADEETSGTPVPGSDRPVRWFLFDRASQINMDHLLINDTYGPAIHGMHWTDAVLEDVSISNCGRDDSGTPANRRAVLILERQSETGDRFDGCNNLKFIGCRWEASQYIACLLNDYSRHVFFIGCKWHGKFYGDDHGPTIDFPAVDIQQFCYGIDFTGCRFANWKQTFIKATKATVGVSNSVLSGAGRYATSDAYAIDLEDCVGCAIAANNFATSVVFGDGLSSATETDNGDGNVRITRGRNNVMSTNGIYPTPVIRLDEFNLGIVTSGAIGGLGWSAGSSGTASTVSQPADETGHSGIFRVTSATASLTTGLWAPKPGVLDNDSLSLDPGYLFDLTFIARFNSGGSSVGYQVGLTDQDATVFSPTNGIYLQKATSGGNWFGVCRASSSENLTGSAVGTFTATVWFELRLRRFSATTIGFSINGGTEQPLAVTVPTARLKPFIVLKSTDGASKNFDVDYFDLKVGFPL